jgi:hypothetical protein
MSDTYVARVEVVPDRGIRLDPVPEARIPDAPAEVNLLAVSIALALGQAGYEHHPEPRNPNCQTLEALLAGEVVIPWRAAGGSPVARQAVCERSADGVWQCRVEEDG